MIQTDEDALICDLAETYGIFDYRQLPADQVAVFAFGLRDDSRIKLAMTNSKFLLKPFCLQACLIGFLLLFGLKQQTVRKESTNH